MPIPSYPENRREAYLNNIATGSGEIPPYPENREEQYLDAIAQNGGGGGGGGSTGGGVLMIEYDEELSSLNKTFREVETAFIAGTTVMWYVDTINGVYYLMDGLEAQSLVILFGGGNILMADSEDGYLYQPD